MSNKFVENLSVLNKRFDLIDYRAEQLLDEMFPNTSQELLSEHERVYGLKSTGDIATRRNRVLAAIRAKGGLSKDYLKSIGDTLGSGRYTIALTEGTDPLQFVVHTYSKNTVIGGPATVLTGVLRSLPIANSCYTITITVTGGINPETDLEELMQKLKPAWTELIFTYV